MRIFVTGSTGVVGRRLVPLLVSQGHSVTAAARTPEKRMALERQGVSAVAVDVFDEPALRSVVASHDTIINLATHMPASTTRMMLPGVWRENDRVRRVGSANLVNAAIANGAQRFLQESFAPIYADRGNEWIDERWRVEPVRYNRSVLDAERSATRFTESGGVGVILRFAGFYGPDAFTTHDTIKMVRRGWAPLPGSPEAFFSSISHDDAAAAVSAALDVSAGVYNVTDDEPLRRREYFESLADALGVAPPKLLPRWMVPLMGSIGRLLSRSQRISNRKLRDATGWAPRFASVRQGWPAVVRAVDAAHEHV